MGSHQLTPAAQPEAVGNLLAAKLADHSQAPLHASYLASAPAKTEFVAQVIQQLSRDRFVYFDLPACERFLPAFNPGRIRSASHQRVLLGRVLGNREAVPFGHLRSIVDLQELTDILQCAVRIPDQVRS